MQWFRDLVNSTKENSSLQHRSPSLLELLENLTFPHTNTQNRFVLSQRYSWSYCYFFYSFIVHKNFSTVVKNEPTSFDDPSRASPRGNSVFVPVLMLSNLFGNSNITFFTLTLIRRQHLVVNTFEFVSSLMCGLTSLLTPLDWQKLLKR